MSEKETSIAGFETMRHGEKAGEVLSERGREHAREKARELLKEIERLPDGAVVFLTPSNVGRAVETRDIIVAELKELCKEEPGVEFISVHDAERIKQAKGDFSKKYIITEVQPTRALGFHERSRFSPTYVKYRNMYKGNEDLTGMTWAAQPEEMEALKTKITQQYPEVDIDQIQPKQFIDTPEETALKHLRLMKRMVEITNKHFPGHSWKGIFVGHTPSIDFATATLLGKEISMKTIEEMGGKLRDFLESAHFRLEGDKIIATYRNQDVTLEKDMETLIEELKAASSEREKEWKQM